MATPQAIRWKTNTTTRAASISANKWAEHKEEICALYLKMTLDELIATMKARHGFEASRRQYISQFEKWQCVKYNVPKVPDANEFRCSSRFSSSPLAERMLREDLAQSTKVGKKVVDDLNIDNEDIVKHGISRVKESQSTTQLEVVDRGTLHLPWLVNNHATIADGLAEETLVTHTIRDKFQLPANTMTSDDIVQLLLENDENSATNDPRVQLNKRRNVADFLLITGCSEEAFEVYAAYLDESTYELDPGAWYSDFAFMGCIRSALERVRNTLSLPFQKRDFSTQHLSMPWTPKCFDLHAGSVHLDLFLMQALLEDLDQRNWDDGDSMFRHSTFVDEGSRLLEADADQPHYLQRRTVHLEFYAQLRRRSPFYTDRTRIEDLLTQRLAMDRAGQGMTVGAGIFETCIQWCKNELHKNKNIGRLDLLDLQDDAASHYIEVLLLFLSLWKRWQAEALATCVSDNSLCWASSTYDSYFISQTDVLFVVCGLLLDRSSRRQPLDQQPDVKSSLGTRALWGAQDMDNYNLDGLTLLGTYIRLQQQRSSSKTLQTKRIRVYVMSCLRETLLPGGKQYPDTNPGVAFNTIIDRQSMPVTSTFVEPFAISLDSKSYDSFRKTHDQTKARIMKLSSPQKLSWRHLSSPMNSMRSLQNSMNSMDLK